VPGARANDGVVPIRSQVWGDIAWAGFADHLDVLGHFQGTGPGDHVDWMTSHSGFGLPQFHAMADALAAGMLAGAQR
jgi:hypothetical protein